MSLGFWDQVIANGLEVPKDRPLADVTEELTRMLGDPDPRVRDEIAFPALATWIDEGVYDDLLVGLGDGIATGLAEGLGNVDDSVFRRSWSAAVLAEIVDRDTSALLLAPDVVLRWGDQLMTWLCREQDLRGFVPGRGYAHAVAHGADTLGALARSPHFGRLELIVVLDVIADRLLLPTEEFLTAGEDDRLAFATMHLLCRNLLGLDVLTPWANRLAAGATPSGDPDHHPFHVAGNVQSYLRSLYLQLAVGDLKPEVRADLLLVLREALRSTNPFLTVAHE